ncbi:hypothetical protein [Streptomyces glaucus]|uniref:Uncharacterized protein n=1 Tax=Streptomyces glaucus TaxID=284029 RepID=A0ABN3JZW8_9ACTN
MQIHTAPNFDALEPTFGYADITFTSAYDKTDEGLGEGMYDAADRDLTVFTCVGAERTASKGRS